MLPDTIFPDNTTNTTNTTVYDDLGRVKFSVDARGATNAFGYDPVGNRITATNAWGTALALTNSFAFDGNGNQTTSWDALGRSTFYAFDALNRLTNTTFPDFTTTSTLYDPLGRLAAVTNQDGIVSAFGYDGAGRLIAATNGLGAPQTTWALYQYDAAGNQTNQVDALGRTNTYTCDGLGRRTGHTLPGGQTENFGYDLTGNPIYVTNCNRVSITNQYDPLNRLLSRTSAAGYRATFAYSPTGQRTNLTDASGATSYGYDARDRLLAKTNAWASGPTRWLNYLYDANGNLTNLWSGTSGGVSNYFQFDALNRLTNVLANGSAACAYGYDGAGNLQTVRYGNGVTNLCQYDRLNRLTNAVWMTNAGTLASFYYQLGRTGNRTNLTETLTTVVSGRTYAWQYDSLYRLTNENVSTLGNLAYGYDLVGNRTNRTSSVGGLANQSFTFTSNDWLGGDAYDSNGNTVSNSLDVLYQYDPLNHLANANSGAVLLWCDADGNRLRKEVTSGSTTNTFYLLDDRNGSGYVQVLEEWTVASGATNLARVYNYGLSLISQRQPSVSTNYFICDGHGSTRMLTDAGGNVANAFTYDAYGNLIASNAAPQTFYLYCGQQWDPGLGQYYQRARMLNPNTGRFFTSDTDEGDQEDPSSLHKYNYCEGNPLNGIDPLGEAMSWKSYFGYEAEDAIQTEYKATHPGDVVSYGQVMRVFKPDIYNVSKKTFLEIKPISGSGIASGLLQLGIYKKAFKPFKPEVTWQPRSCLLETAEDGLIYVINVQGIVFYQDIDEIKWGLITATSIKVAYDLLPYLVRLSATELAPVVVRMTTGLGTAFAADIQETTGIATLDSLEGAP